MTWQTKPLGELCRIEIGGTPSRSSTKYWDKGKATNNVWLSIADMPKTLHASISASSEHLSDQGAEKVKLVKAGTLLVSFKLTLGRLAYAGIDLRTNEAIAALTLLDSSRLQKEYLYWYLTFFDWQKAAEGEDKVKGKTLNKAKLSVLPVLLPPVAEQHRIVALLDEAFAGIATAKANVEKNLRNTEELFDGLRLAAFDAACWDEKPFEDCIEDVTYTNKIQRKNFLDEGDYPVISQEEAFINGYWNSAADVFRVDRPLVLFGDHTKALKYVDFDFVLGADGVKILKPKLFLHPRFFYHQLRTAKLDSLGYARHYKLLKELVIRYPSQSEQQRIATELDSADEQAEHLESIYTRKLAALDELKQSLLQRAFSGELT